MMAIKASPNGRLTLAEIYEFINKNFEYYRTYQADWQNAIRHNLSVSEYFIRTPRGYDEPGRGGYWSLSPIGKQLFIGDDTGRLRQPAAPPMNYHFTTVPPMQQVAYQCGNCGLVGCMCYQTATIIPQMLPEYFNMTHRHQMPKP
ncbi:forkhead box protein G1-like [Hermetia illucens]|nr:forkhead box protein G1-like [Hermetia illucens]